MHDVPADVGESRCTIVTIALSGRVSAASWLGAAPLAPLPRVNRPRREILPLQAALMHLVPSARRGAGLCEGKSTMFTRCKRNVIKRAYGLLMTVTMVEGTPEPGTSMYK